MIGPVDWRVNLLRGSGRVTKPDSSLGVSMLKVRVLALAAFAAAALSLTNSDVSAKRPLANNGFNTKIQSPLAGDTFSEKTSIEVEADFTLDPKCGICNVFLEITGSNKGNTYYFGDNVTAYSPGGTIYFTPCNALPPGTYRITVSSDATPSTDHSIEITVVPAGKGDIKPAPVKQWFVWWSSVLPGGRFICGTQKYGTEEQARQYIKDKMAEEDKVNFHYLLIEGVLADEG